MADKEFRLAPINPFSEREQILINLIINGQNSKKKIAMAMGMKTISAAGSFFYRTKMTAETITGKPIYSKSDFLKVLHGDVLFLR